MKPGLKWGIILGVSICLWTMGLHWLGWYTENLKAGQQADIAAFILPVVTMVCAILERRRNNPGQTLTIGEGVSTGLIVGLVSVPISALFLLYYHHHVNPQWVEHLVDYERSRLAATGATVDAISSSVTAIRKRGEDGAQLMGALVGTVILSLVLSLVISVVLRRSKPTN